MLALRLPLLAFLFLRGRGHSHPPMASPARQLTDQLTDQLTPPPPGVFTSTASPPDVATIWLQSNGKMMSGDFHFMDWFGYKPQDLQVREPGQGGGYKPQDRRLVGGGKTMSGGGALNQPIN